MREFWEERYAEEAFAYGTEPNSFLVDQAHRIIPGGQVLVAGDGEGRNGVWLAQQGFKVLAVDYAEAGLAKARALANAREVSLETMWADLTSWPWPLAGYDAVVSIFLHLPPAVRPHVHGHMLNALRPGGVLILEAFSKEQLNYDSGGPPDESLLYSVEMLRRDFAKADIELLCETIYRLAEGRYHRGDGAVVRLVARRSI